MKTFIFTLSLLLAISCGHRNPDIHIKTVGVEEEFLPYLQDFSNLSDGKIGQEEVKGLSIKFTKLPGNTIGICYRWLNGTKEIVIDKNYWEWASYLTREALMYHELVHCVCNRSHDFIGGTYSKFNPFMLFESNEKSGYFEDSCPFSIMHPEMMDDSCLNRRWDYYKKEMFLNCSP